MKTLFVFSCMVALVVGINACNNNAVDPTTTDGSARSSSVTSGTVTGPHNLTTVDVSTLPAAVTSYISTNYAGATIKDARKDDQGRYLVAITVSSVVKLLVFNADGTFVKEVSGRPKHMPGDSAHHVPGDSTHHHPPRDSTHFHAPGDTTHHITPGDSTRRPRRGPGGHGH
ncbi:hypothetical protein [Spirosoma sp. KNUC1025]|uniref:hypothetical protein n=1 Tax=Spirosoma sp. KNUC1025 TaxID=2894082 RepID=UPI003864E4DD|nr:hypothetical protein LN737_06370 [Spirosoma sp. KNUC1025]